MWLTWKSHTFFLSISLLYGYSPKVTFIFTVCTIERSQIQILPLLFPAAFGFSVSVLVSFPHNLTDHSEKGQKFSPWYSLWFISTQTKVHPTHTHNIHCNCRHLVLFWLSYSILCPSVCYLIIKLMILMFLNLQLHVYTVNWFLK